MHARSPPILHRDLKPENILISSSRELVSRFSYDAKPFDEEKNLPVVVSDFGLSRVMEKSFCESGVGSLPYVAPECWRRQYSGKADIWSLGCILYAMCSFNVDRSNVKVMFSECNNPTFTEKIMEEVVSFGYSMSFAQFVVFLLTVDPAQRPSATEALDFLMTSPEESCKPLLRLLI
ncbi:Protein kinase domain/Protein tyrosine kinase, putative [Angomonas deanei]|uniref:non-specific serine/threonine protein kinase n=1 Tax=Angomonas deanei TaxID=59799 RepID=A0A7G2CC90_9TRYP|nr:Protein kinase domain/Protein tyrosine kinase, putative [Angomonas deanei]